MIRKFMTRLLCLFGFCFLLLIVGFSYSVYKLTHPKGVEIASSAVLDLKLEGPLEEGPSSQNFMLPAGAMTSLRDIIDTLHIAAHDGRIKGLRVHLDGVQFVGLAQIQELRQAIHAFRKRGKFASVYCDTFGEISSGMALYYFASAFDEIWMAPMGNLNITGLASVQPFARRLLDELGIYPDIEAREEYKTAYDTALKSEMTSANRQEVQEMLNSLMDQMIKAIALERELSEATVIDAVNRAPHFKLEPLKQEGFIDYTAFLEEFREAKLGKLDHTVQKVKFHDYVANLTKEKGKSDTKIAVIFGNGMITKEAQKGNPLLPSMVMEVDDIQAAFKEAEHDSTIKAVVFRIDSPGGSPLVSDVLWHTVERFQKISKKPVIVSMGNVAASGGYWIAAPAHKIVANPGTITGSIGVLSGKIASAKLWEKLNVQWDMVKTHDNAAIWNMIYPFTSEEKKIVSDMTDHVYETFMQKVSQGRHLSMDHVRQVAKGRVWTGEQALKWGLVDRLGDLNTAIDLAKQEAKLDQAQTASAKVLYLPYHKPLFERLLNLTKGNFKISTFLAQVIKIIWQDISIGIHESQKNSVMTSVSPLS